MLKKTILLEFFIVVFLFSCEAKNWTRVSPYSYPELFRDHVFDSLTDNGKKMFYALEIHPSCVEKKGHCIPRARCIGRDMLYISRICYKRDLVCCYDSSIRFPTVAEKHATTSTTSTSTTETAVNVTTTKHP